MHFFFHSIFLHFIFSFIYNYLQLYALTNILNFFTFMSILCTLMHAIKIEALIMGRNWDNFFQFNYDKEWLFRQVSLKSTSSL